jgi:hypothetical protein
MGNFWLCGDIDIAVHKIYCFLVDFLREFEAILKKVVWWKNQRMKILCQGPFKQKRTVEN